MAKARTLVLNGITYKPVKAVKKAKSFKALTFTDKLQSLKTFVNKRRNAKSMTSIVANGLTQKQVSKGTTYTLKGADIVYKDGTTAKKFYLECAGYLRSWKA